MSIYLRPLHCALPAPESPSLEGPWCCGSCGFDRRRICLRCDGFRSRPRFVSLWVKEVGRNRAGQDAHDGADTGPHGLEIAVDGAPEHDPTNTMSATATTSDGQLGFISISFTNRA
jgi:hypothetical protein